jgi:hypothetical protein
MPSQITEFRCLLISPGDVSDERETLVKAIQRWNGQVGKGLNARIELVMWESHSTPDLSNTHPQKVLNPQIVHDCDLGVAVFWSRLGTPTDTHASGSVEEIEELVAKKARVMVYFSKRDVPQAQLIDKQFKKLQKFKTSLMTRGLLDNYLNVEELETKVILHLTRVISEMLQEKAGATISTAPIPDVKIEINKVNPLRNQPIAREWNRAAYLGIEVQNHSPSTVYIDNVCFETEEPGRRLIPLGDAMTMEYQRRRELPSGQSFSVHIDLEEGLKGKDVNYITNVVATDAVGREYKYNEARLYSMMKAVLEDNKRFNKSS